jgi:hypothetical protein
MTLLPKIVLACGAAVSVAGISLPAAARSGQPHIVTLRLADGGLVQVRYTGETSPVVVEQAVPELTALPDPDPAFAALEQLSALMERQEAVMLREAAMLTAMPMTPGALPAGAQYYSYSSSVSANGTCTRSTAITYTGGGLKPRMVSSTSGDCSAAKASPGLRIEAPHIPAHLMTASAPETDQAAIRPAVEWVR